MGTLIVLVGGFASGVFVRSLFFDSWMPVVFIIFLAALLGAVSFLKPRLVYSLGALFCVFMVLGMLRATIANTPLPQVFAAHVGERVGYAARVVSDPDIREKNQRIAVLVSYGGAGTRMLAVVPRDSSVQVGDRVWVTGTLALPQPFDTEGGRVFRYDKYLERDGIRFLLNFGYIRRTSPAPWYSLSAFLARIKHTFLDGLARVLPPTNAALAGGIVIGGKTGLDKDLQQAFVTSGLVQIIVLSGYNVMVVATWIMELLSLTRLSRRWVALCGAVALTLFVGIAGFSATAIRAMCMALIALYARATGRTYTAGRALLFVVLLMLVWNPLYLVFDPGFGLSVAATAGLIWLSPLIEKKLVRIKFKWMKEALSTTLAAQYAVLPLLLYDMGIFSFVAIPANILVAPLVPLAMGWSVVAGFAGIIFGSAAPLIGTLFASASYVLTWCIIEIATVSSSFSYSAVTLPAFPFLVVLVAYALLIYRAVAASKRVSTTDQLRFAKKASI